MRPFPCRLCGAQVDDPVVDLGMTPLCETYVTEEELDAAEYFYPLNVWVCGSCFLVQVKDYVGPADIFTEYAYFSSYSTSWLRHAEDYVVTMCERLGLGDTSFVLELASNDGYLLQYFVERGISCLGVEPSENVSRVALERGVPTEIAFFGEVKGKELAAAGRVADLVVANNVLAQVPSPNDFVAGIPHVLKPQGTLTVEFPHVVRLLEESQFDTIYHEHFSYFSLTSAEALLARHGLTVFDVEELWTHGGSLRVYARHADDPSRTVSERVEELRRREETAGYRDVATYGLFEERVRETKRKLLSLLVGLKRSGKVIVGYGAPGKGNTLLNYCGVRTDFVDFTVDRNPYKQGLYLPGTHIPIHAPERIDQVKPDFILILPWNVKDEITEQLAHVRKWGTRFIVPIPEATIT
jgi:SAM-dependent methyltransferase